MHDHSTVILLWGSKEIESFYTPHLSDKRAFNKMLKAIKTYHLENADEAEGFRKGVIEAGVIMGRDAEELSESSLKDLDKRYARAKARW